MSASIEEYPIFKDAVAVASAKTSSDDLTSMLANPKHRFVLVAPECMGHLAAWQDESKRQWGSLDVVSVTYPVSLFFIDEAHLIHCWDTFRDGTYSNHSTLIATSLPRVMVRLHALLFSIRLFITTADQVLLSGTCPSGVLEASLRKAFRTCMKDIDIVIRSAVKRNVAILSMRSPPSSLLLACSFDFLSVVQFEYVQVHCRASSSTCVLLF
jgi:hypothetical protein